MKVQAIRVLLDPEERFQIDASGDRQPGTDRRAVMLVEIANYDTFGTSVLLTDERGQQWASSLHKLPRKLREEIAELTIWPANDLP